MVSRAARPDPHTAPKRAQAWDRVVSTRTRVGVTVQLAAKPPQPKT